MKIKSYKYTFRSLQEHSITNHIMKNLFYLLTIALLSYSCSKEGPGGKVTISGRVLHHSKPVPGAKVYIKYGTVESPGNNVTYYNASVVADAKAFYQFKDYKKGKYYLFATGFDSSMVVAVSGGAPLKIAEKEATLALDIQVVE